LSGFLFSAFEVIFIKKSKKSSKIKQQKQEKLVDTPPILPAVVRHPFDYFRDYCLRNNMQIEKTVMGFKFVPIK